MTLFQDQPALFVFPVLAALLVFALVVDFFKGRRGPVKQGAPAVSGRARFSNRIEIMILLVLVLPLLVLVLAWLVS